MFAFVILHYKSINETIKCLESLKTTFNDSNYKAIVVDNASLSDKDIKKIEEYTKDIIKLEKNVGFAKANNKGCAYAKEKYNPKFIAVINNDVFITQKEFMTIVEEDFEKFNFDMMGPKINSRTGESCNPFPIIYGKKNIHKQLEYQTKLERIYQSSIKYFMLKVYLKLKHIIKKPIVPTNGERITTNVGLHGCAVIFSKKYLDKYKDTFYDGTFLFHEEEFLFLRVKKDNLISLYDPSLEVYHQEGSSLSKKNKNVRKAKLFRTREIIKSLKLLQQEMQGD